MDEFTGMGIVFVLGIVIGAGLLTVLIMFFVSDGVFDFNGERFVRVSAEQEEDWCEEWVCEEKARSPISTDCSYDCDGKLICNHDLKCVSESLVRRRC